MHPQPARRTSHARPVAARSRRRHARRTEELPGNPRHDGVRFRSAMRLRCIDHGREHMHTVLNAWEALTARLRGIGQWIPPLILRLIMAWEFWESGTEKYSGDNWFMQIQDKFPFPFSKIPA